MNGTCLRWLVAFAFAGAAWAAIAAPERAHAAEPIHIVALGDSLSSGWEINPRYELHVERDLYRTAYSVNMAYPGRTSAGLLDAVRNDAAVRDALAGAEIVTLEIGINDFRFASASYLDGTCGGDDGQDCLRTMHATFVANWDSILAELDALRAPGTIIRAFDIYYAFVGFGETGETPPFAVLNPYLLAMNEHIHASASTASNMGVVDAHAIFNGPGGTDDPLTLGFTDDGIHPNAAGGAAVADAFRALGYAPLARSCADVNADFRVNILDIAMLAKRVGVPPDTVPDAYDVNGDNSINLLDLRIAVRQYGALCP